MDHQTKQFNAAPAWINAVAIHEAERIYEMMPRTMGEKAHVIARLAAGIIELLSREQEKHAALTLLTGEELPYLRSAGHHLSVERSLSVTKITSSPFIRLSTGPSDISLSAC